MGLRELAQAEAEAEHSEAGAKRKRRQRGFVVEGYLAAASPVSGTHPRSTHDIPCFLAVFYNMCAIVWV
eukprot:COSAG05_NODE_1363_length_5081_cov_1.577479_2_plen_69_part_00